MGWPERRASLAGMSPDIFVRLHGSLALSRVSRLCYGANRFAIIYIRSRRSRDASILEQPRYQRIQVVAIGTRDPTRSSATVRAQYRAPRRARLIDREQA